MSNSVPFSPKEAFKLLEEFINEDDYTANLRTDTQGFYETADATTSSIKIIAVHPVECSLFIDLKMKNQKNLHDQYNSRKPLPISVIIISENFGKRHESPRMLKLSVKLEQDPVKVHDYIAYIQSVISSR